MINASRANVFWILGETPTIGSMPAGEQDLVLQLVVVVLEKWMCSFGLANNFAMTIDANLISFWR